MRLLQATLVVALASLPTLAQGSAAPAAVSVRPGCFVPAPPGSLRAQARVVVFEVESVPPAPWLSIRARRRSGS